MRTSKTALTIVVMFVLALGAGVVAGKLTSRLPAPPANTAADQTPLVQELQLTAEQRDQMRSIWEQVRDSAADYGRQARDIQRDHDEAVQALLNPEQAKEYARLSKQAHDQIANLDVKRRAAFQNAIEKTKRILNDEQRKAYEEIIKGRLGTTSGGGTGL